MSYNLDDANEVAQAGRIQPKNKKQGFNKGIFLKNVEFTKSKNDNDIVKFSFEDKDGDTFMYILNDPANGTEDQKKNNLVKFRHLYGAFINSPIIETVNAKGRKIKVKQCFSKLSASSFQELHEVCFNQFVPNYQNLELTLKLTYSKKGNNIQFPLYPPFIASVLNDKLDKIDSWTWDNKYDFDEPQEEEEPRPDDDNLGGNSDVSASI